MVAVATAPESTTGLDLRLARVRRRLTVTSVAAAAQLSRQRISAIEASARPTAAAIERYHRALEQAEARR